VAVALWRWHEAQKQTNDQAAARLKDRSDWDEPKLLLIQGDFFGIQDFIFADGSQIRKDAARLLRGRSFQVSLFTELAALKVLDALELPPISQITNAAGKFLIVAPNTADAQARLDGVRAELNQWFLDHSFGLAGLGLAGKEACCNDFLNKGTTHDFKALMNGLFADLEKAKLHRFDLTADTPAVFPVDYPHGVCMYNDRLRADRDEGGNKASSALSRDQIKIGRDLARQDRLLVLRQKEVLTGNQSLEVEIFGYAIAFTQSEAESGRFGQLAHNGMLARCWDFSLPVNMNDTLWSGYARRYINAFVPCFEQFDWETKDKYENYAEDISLEDVEFSAGKTLDHIACEDRWLKKDDHGNQAKWVGQVALMTLKGDVDNLGTIFQQGLQAPTFAKMAALSRQMNAFFAIWLPALCAEKFPNTYTVFAGGDDFFLMGPWLTTQKLAACMAGEFKAYVAHNPCITFSAGMCMTKPGLPMHTLAAQAEEALDAAKASSDPNPAQRKNAVVLFNERVRWPDWPALQAAQQQLDDVRNDYNLSTSYVYSLLYLIDLAADTQNPENAMWRSRFAYRTRRLVDKLKDKAPLLQRAEAQKRLAAVLGEQGIAKLGTRFRIPLFNHFYQQR
jgi:CRISPR-associated protein Csm1